MLKLSKPYKEAIVVVTAIRQDVCSCCVTPCKEMKDSHFKSVTELNHLAHLPNTPFWGCWGPGYAHRQARFFSGH